MADLVVEKYLDRIIQQYKDAENLKFLIKARLGKIAEAVQQFPDASILDVDTVGGDLLTAIGNLLGFPRKHTVVKVPSIFGFGTDQSYKIVGFGEGGQWLDLADFRETDVVISDDEYYRRFVKARIASLGGGRNIATIEACAFELWGDGSGVLDSGNGRTVIATGRELDDVEQLYWQIYAKFFPVPLGTRAVFHQGSMHVLGFGLGWGGFGEIIYFDGLPLATQRDDEIITENDETIFTAALTADAPWMREYDPLKIGD